MPTMHPHRSTRRSVAILVGVAVALVTGCGRATLSPTSAPKTLAPSAAATAIGTLRCSPPPQAPGPGVALIGCFVLSGHVALTGGFVDTLSGSGTAQCATLAAGGTPGFGSGQTAFLAPGPQAETVDGTTLTWSLAIGPGYHGPGTYTVSAAVNGVTLGTDVYVPGDGRSTITATVSTDGSGTLSATGLVDTAGNSEALTETWSCRDAAAPAG
jgi:hypothetical protein